jgi:hypothetical protein
VEGFVSAKKINGGQKIINCNGCHHRHEIGRTITHWKVLKFVINYGGACDKPV